MRIGIVNDLRLATEAIRRLLATQPDLTVAWTAEDGSEAVERCRRDVPDLVLMDLVMPVLDGVGATKAIMKTCPCPILVVTATIEGNLDRVYAALGAGALDAVHCPTLGDDGGVQGGAPLLKKIRTIARLSGPAQAVPAGPTAPGPARLDAGRLPLVLLGASTGGPEALSVVLRDLPADLHVPIVIVQHLDKDFVPGLVEWLARESRRDVRVVRAGDVPTAGVVHVAAGDDHLVLGRDGRMHYEAEPADNPYRPSVDVFAASAATVWPTPGVAVLLTGMGRDGAQGLLRLQRAGWTTIAQDESTSVVYGMPRAARETGAAGAVLPLRAIGPAVANALRARNGTR